MKTSDSMYNYVTTLQGVVNGIVNQLDDLIARKDTEFLNELRRLLQMGDLKYPNSGLMFTAADRRWLNALQKEIESIRSTMFIEAKDLVYVKTRDEIIPAIEEEAKAELERLGDEIDGFHKKNPKTIWGLTQQQKKNILDYEPYDGHSISKWFDSLSDADTNRIMQDVQKVRSSGGTLQDLMKRLMSYPNNTNPTGSLITSRNSARMIARTTLNGVANNSRLGVFEANSDFLDGVQFLATLDSRTSTICATLDGTIWTMEEVKAGLVKRPPLHPNCRSVLIPYIKLEGEDSPEDLEEGEGRAAEREDFEKMAEDRHNAKVAETGKGKKWKNLSYEYRKYKVYREMDEYQKKTGNRGYKNLPPNTTFEEYFKKQPESFQRNWLGKMKYDAYKAGRLQFKDLVNPRTGYVQSVNDLKKAGKIIAQDKLQKSETNLSNTKSQNIPPTNADEFIKQVKQRDIQYDKELDKLKLELQKDIDVLKNEYQDISDILAGKKSSNKSVSELSRYQSQIIDKIKKTKLEGELKQDVIIEKRSKEYLEILFPNTPPSDNPKVVFENVDNKIKNKKVLSSIDAGKEYMERVVYNSGGYTDTTQYTIQPATKRYGSCYRNNTKSIEINEKESSIFAVFMHETAHGLSYNIPELRTKLQSFLAGIEDKNSGKQTFYKEYFDEFGQKFKVDFKYKSTTIPMPSHYCTYINKLGNCEELLTMFFTCLCDDTTRRSDMNSVIKNPSDFAKQYPDYFNAILALLKK
jgi:SPP1 gp7 family putative phage head morphogenesis protein